MELRSVLALNYVEQFYHSAIKLQSELNIAIAARDFPLIQLKLADIDDLLQYYSQMSIDESDPQVAVVSDCLNDLLATIDAAITLFVVEQSEISNQLANIKVSKRISAVYKQSNSNEP
jgi:hypothetical protein